METATQNGTGRYNIFETLPNDPNERRQVLNDWVQRVPASRPQAIVERRDCIEQKRQIEVQLGDDDYQSRHGMDDLQYRTWRGRAKRSLSLREGRIGFLREWLRQNPESRSPRELRPGDLSPTHTLRQAVQIVGQLEAVYRAGLEWLDDPDQTDETQKALIDEIELARMTIGEMIA